MIWRTHIAILSCAALVGCDAVWGLDGALPAQDGGADSDADMGTDGAPPTWCQQDDNLTARFCADFDTSADFEGFTREDQSSPAAAYTLVNLAVSAPNAARLVATAGPTNTLPKARLQHIDTTLDTSWTVKFSVLVEQRTSNRFRIVSMTAGNQTLALFDDGQLWMFPDIATDGPPIMVGTCSLESGWTDVTMALDIAEVKYSLETPGCMLSDNQGVPGNPAMLDLELGPHVPFIESMAGSASELFDNVIVR